MLTKRGITLCILSIALTIYLVIALAASHGMAAVAPCNGININISQNDMSQFVTAGDIDQELRGIIASADTTCASAYNLKQIEDRLAALSIIESVNCTRLANDKIAIDIVPMVPVARVFDSRNSFYINAEGKHLAASARYKIDVPVIIADCKSPRQVTTLIPLIQRINENPTWSQLVTALKIDSRGDIYIVPSMAGHLVNFGDENNIDDKMKRLISFYKQVLEVRGWNYYDTISVKFANQVIGKVAPGAKREKAIDPEDYEYEEDDIDIEVISQRDSVDVADLKPKIL